MITILMAWWSSQTQESWTFYIVVATFLILILGIIWGGKLVWGKKRDIQKISICYLRPKRHYPNNLTFEAAPDEEEYPTKLTVNVGTYTLFVQMHSPIDIKIVTPLRISFTGNEANKPKLIGKNNPFIRERLSNGHVRDWWGDMQQPEKKYPYLFFHTDCFQEPNQIQAFGKWQGKMSIDIPIEGIGKIERQLEFAVSLNPNDDDVPYLKNFGIVKEGV